MLLEYLPDGSPNGPLLRLYEFTPGEARQLHDRVAALAAGLSDRVDLHLLQWIKPIGDCRLTFFVRDWDQDVLRKAGPAEFECTFTPSTWDNVAGLIAPFAAGAQGYQWLGGAAGEAHLLLSVDGRW
jgi:hypothetical protein